MNELDSEVIIGQLLNLGLTQTEDETKADLIIFNTCSIRDLAERKVMGKLGQLGRKKKKSLIGVMGCMARAKKESLLKKFPHIDFVLGPNNITDLQDSIKKALTNQKTLKTEDKYEDNLNYLIAKRNNPYKAYVSIIKGCNKFCTYCVVPHLRGRETSRPSDEILLECKALAEKGYKEIILLGQNVNSYGKDFISKNYLFHDLLNDIDKINGIERIRFMTSHPIDITIELMHAVRDIPSVCEFVHFPLQAGSNRILKKMHRIYTKEEYFDKVATLKELIPNIKIGTDIIVGFPTETEDDFLQTIEAFQKIRFSLAYIFAYSKRKNTAAYRFIDDVSEDTKQQRLQTLLSLHDQITKEDKQKEIGSIKEVLVERLNKDNLTLKGKTRCHEKVIFKGNLHLLGTTQKVKLEKFNHQTFLGTLCS